MDKWYVARGDAKKGPFTIAQLRSFVERGQLRATDLLRREGSEDWVAAGTFSVFFPAPENKAPPPIVSPVTESKTTRPTETSSIAASVSFPPVAQQPKVEQPAAAQKSRAKQKFKPLWIGGAVGVGVLLVAGLMYVTSDSDHGVDAPAPHGSVPPSSAAASDQNSPAAPGSPGAAATGSKPATLDVGFPLPPVGPANVAAGDPVMAKFMKARAAYLGARVQARLDVAKVFRPALEAIENGNLDAAAKASARQELSNAQQAYFQGGQAPTHPVVKQALEDYTRSIEAENRKFGAAAEEALAAYEKQGVSDQTKLRPLQAGRLCVRHPELLGAWKRDKEFWIIDFDERTGGFQAAGIESDHLSTYAVFHGKNFQFKDGVLSFSAVQLSTNNGREWATGMTVTMAPQDGALRYEMRDRVTGSEADPKTGKLTWLKKTVTATLHRSMDFGTRLDSGGDFVHLTHYLKLAGITSLDHETASSRPAEKLDAADANSVWRRLAHLSSFDYLLQNGQRPIAHQQLYIPYRFSQFTPQTPFERLTSNLLLDYQTIADCPHPYLKHAAAVSLIFARKRHRLAQAAHKYGDTRASEVADFDRKQMESEMRYAMLREKYRSILANEWRPVFSAEVPLHDREDYQADLAKIMALDDRQVTPDHLRVSTLMAYADMDEVDRNVAFWQQMLLPLARRCAGPKAEHPLVNVTAGWQPNRAISGRGLQRLGVFGVQNVSDSELTHVVIELAAENEWQDKATHYCYVPHLNVGGMISLLPHPRLNHWLLDYSATIKVTWSVWADQAVELNRITTLTNPAPHPEAAKGRDDHLHKYSPSRSDWEALALTMHRTTPLPGDEVAHRVLVRTAIGLGSRFVFRLEEPGKSQRTLLLQLKPTAEKDEVQAEITDASTKRPFSPGTPVWNGKLNSQGLARIHFSAGGSGPDSTWDFAIGRDDQPVIVCDAAGKPGAVFPMREIPLFPVTNR